MCYTPIALVLLLKYLETNKQIIYCHHFLLGGITMLMLLLHNYTVNTKHKNLNFGVQADQVLI